MATNEAGGALINFGDLSKPATVLIEKISDAVGGIAKPWQTKRVARAEAEAEIIRAQARVEISEIEERAILRMVREEGKKQENIESITNKAIPHLSPEAKPEDIENDWITHFFDRSRLVSDTEMQSLWANILSGEANSPGSFAKKTVDLVATLDKSDAQLFTKLCTFAWMISGITLIIPDVGDKIFNDSGINFMSLTHLNDIGLLTYNNMTGFKRQYFPKYTTAYYYGQPVTIEFPKDKNELQVGHAILTRAGNQLAPICGSTKSEEYFTYILERWLNTNYTLSTLVALRPLMAK